MQFLTSIMESKLPGDGSALGIALQLKRVDALAQRPQAVHASRQARALENADLDFGHVQPTAMLGRVVKFQPPQDPPSLCGRKGFVEDGCRMHIEIVYPEANVLRLGIDRINQPANSLGIPDTPVAP